MRNTTEKNHNLLIIDDELEITKALVRQFKTKYTVFSATSAEEGLTIMDNEDIQVVISDQRMPGMSGVDFFASIKEKYPDTFKLILTGFSDINAVIGAINDGQVFRYLKKPWNPTDLDSIIKEAFEKHDIIIQNRVLRADLQKANAELEENVEKRTNELKLTHESLNESRNRFLLLYENAPLSYQSLNPQACLIDVNKRWLETLGYEKEEVIGRYFGEFMTPESAELIKERFPVFVATGSLHDYVFNMVRKDGTIITVTYDGTIGYDEFGSFKQTHCIFQDITQKRIFEERLKESEEKFRDLFESSLVGKSTTTLDGRLNSNIAFCEILGYSKEELNKKNWREITYKDDIEQNEKNVQSILKGEVDFKRWEKRYIHKEGHIVWVDIITLLKRDEKGNPSYFITEIMDISRGKKIEKELEESEEKFRTIFESSLVGKSRTALDGKLFLNTAYCQMMGYSKEELNNKNWRDITYEEDIEPNEKIVQSILKGEQDSARWEKRFIHKDGHLVWVDITTLLKRDEKGNPDYFITEIVNISQRKQAEKELEESEINFRSLFEKGPIGIAYHKMIYDDNGKPVDYLFLEANAAYQELTGVNPLGKLVTEAFPGIENDPSDWIGTFGEVAKTGKEIRFQQYLQPNNRWYDCVSYQYKPDHFVAAFLEITQQKIAENGLKESEYRYRNLVNTGQALIWTSGLDKKCNYFNEVWLAFTGRKLEQEMGDGWVEGVHPDDLQHCIDVYVDGFEKRKQFSMEYRIRHHSGEYRWIQDNGSPRYDSNGEFLGFIGHCLDINESKQLEVALEKRIIALTKPLEDHTDFAIEDLFNINELQKLQDDFSNATGVASIITYPDGRPITKPSNFTYLCSEIIRKTDKGCANCLKSDAVIGKHLGSGPTVQTCLSGGLWDAGSGISVGGKHIASWLIGQVRNEIQTEESAREYAHEIGADEETYIKAFRQVPSMSRKQLEDVAQVLYTISTQLSTTAYQNVQQARFISDLKQAEKELIKAKEYAEENLTRLKLATASGRLGIWDWNVKENVMTWDERMFELYGINQDVYTNNIDAWENGLYAEDKQRAIDDSNAALHGEADYDSTFRIVQPNGTILHIKADGLVIRDIENKPIRMIGINKDITEQKQAEMALKKIQLLHNEMEKIGKVGGWEFNIDTLISVWTEETCRIHEVDYFSETTVDSGVNYYTPASRPIIEDAVNRAITYGEPFDLELEIITAKGNLLYVHTIGKVDVENRRVYGFFQDITDRKIAEAKIREKDIEFRKLSANVPDMIYQFTRRPDGSYYVPITTEGILNLFGCKPEDVMDSFEPIANVIHPEDIENLMREIEYSANNLTHFSSEFRVILPEKGIQWIYSRSSPEKLADGSITWYGFNTNTTELKEIQMAMQESERRFRELLSTVNMVSIILDLNGDITFCNDFLLEITHHSREEVLGQNWFDLFIPTEIYELVKGVFKTTIKEREITTNYENTIITKEKEEILISWTNTWLFDNNGNINGIAFLGVDITESRKAELSVIKSKDRLIRAEFASLSGNWELLVDKGILKASKGANNVYGLNSGEFKYESIKEIPLQEFRPLIDKALKDLIENDIPYSIDFKIKRVDTGEIRDINSTATFDKEQHIVFGVIRDITVQKKAEKAITESENQLKMVLRGSRLGFWDWDIISGKVVRDERWAEILGYSIQDIEQNVMNWSSLIHPDDQKAVLKSIDDHVAGLVPQHSEIYRMQHKDGQWIWIHDRAQVVERDRQGKPLRMCGTHEDITARIQIEKLLRQSEEKLSAMFSGMTEMVVFHELVFDAMNQVIDYRIIDCNETFTQITGIPKEDAIGKLATEVYQTEKAPYLAEFSKACISSEIFNFQTYFQPMDKHFIVSTIPLGNNQFATVTTDITDIQHSKEAIIRNNKELENYIYVASHDLRSPLVNIQGFSQRLQKQTMELQRIIGEIDMEENKRLEITRIADEAMPKSLNYVQTNVTKMDRLINGLLHVSRTGRMIMNLRQIDMNKLIASIIGSYNFQFTEINAEVKINKLTSCYGDENQLNQLFSNLISNAIKYQNIERKLNIEISSETHFNKVIYSIRDNGIGIHQKHQEKIWDVFFRVDNTIQEGDGVGLSLVKRIVERHKGKIWVESEEAVGSVFYVQLQKDEFEI